MIRIGQGNRSDIFLSYRSNQPVAVKKFSAIAGTAESTKAILERLILENIKHPHLLSAQRITVVEKPIQVAVLANNSYGPKYVQLNELQYAIEMEYHRKGSLDRYLSILYQDNSVRDLSIEIFRKVLSGLEYLHSHKIVHGSIKADNILVQENGNIKLADFGDAVVMSSAQKIFGIAVREIWNNAISHVTEYDDLMFLNRPTPCESIYLYDFFRSFGQGDVDEASIGLIALFKKIFKMHP